MEGQIFCGNLILISISAVLLSSDCTLKQFLYVGELLNESNNELSQIYKLIILPMIIKTFSCVRVQLVARAITSNKNVV